MRNATLRKRNLYFPWHPLSLQSSITTRTRNTGTFTNQYNNITEKMLCYNVSANDYLIISSWDIEDKNIRKEVEVRMGYPHIPIFKEGLSRMYDIAGNVFEMLEGGVSRYERNKKHYIKMGEFMDGRTMMIAPCLMNNKEDEATILPENTGYAGIVLYLTKTIFGISSLNEFYAFFDFFDKFSLFSESQIAELQFYNKIKDVSNQSVSSPSRGR